MNHPIRHILYATDLSAVAKAALEHAASLAAAYQARLTTVHVIPDILEEMTFGVGIDMVEYHFDPEHWKAFQEEREAAAIREMEARTEEVLKKMAGSGEPPVLEHEVMTRVGHPVSTILEMAHSGAYDLVVMGTKGHSKLGDLILGSVATGVVRRCRIPVMVVPLHP